MSWLDPITNKAKSIATESVKAVQKASAASPQNVVTPSWSNQPQSKPFVQAESKPITTPQPSVKPKVEKSFGEKFVQNLAEAPKKVFVDYNPAVQYTKKSLIPTAKSIAEAPAGVAQYATKIVQNIPKALQEATSDQQIQANKQIINTVANTAIDIGAAYFEKAFKPVFEPLVYKPAQAFGTGVIRPMLDAVFAADDLASKAKFEASKNGVVMNQVGIPGLFTIPVPDAINYKKLKVQQKAGDQAVSTWDNFKKAAKEQDIEVSGLADTAKSGILTAGYLMDIIERPVRKTVLAPYYTAISTLADISSGQFSYEKLQFNKKMAGIYAGGGLDMYGKNINAIQGVASGNFNPLFDLIGDFAETETAYRENHYEELANDPYLKNTLGFQPDAKTVQFAVESENILGVPKLQIFDTITSFASSIGEAQLAPLIAGQGQLWMARAIEYSDKYAKTVGTGTLLTDSAMQWGLLGEDYKEGLAKKLGDSADIRQSIAVLNGSTILRTALKFTRKITASPEKLLQIARSEEIDSVLEEYNNYLSKPADLESFKNEFKRNYFNEVSSFVDEKGDYLTIRDVQDLKGVMDNLPEAYKKITRKLELALFFDSVKNGTMAGYAEAQAKKIGINVDTIRTQLKSISEKFGEMKGTGQVGDLEAEGTLLHEIGHVLEKGAVKDPELAPEWKNIVEMSKGRPGYTYSTPGELFAEGFRYIAKAPATLKSSFPELYDFMSKVQSKMGSIGLDEGKLQAQYLFRGVRDGEELPYGAFSRMSDQKVRIEVDDSKAELKFDQIKKLDKSFFSDASKKLGNILVHDELYKFYPELKNTPVIIKDLDSGTVAGISNINGNDVIVLNRASIGNANEIKSALLHEIQHQIQIKEGFSGGASNRVYENAINKYVKQAGDIATKANKINIDKLNKDLASGKITQEVFDNKINERQSLIDQHSLLTKEIRKLETQQRTEYMQAPGEIEAREVQARMNMTPEERSKRWLFGETPPQTLEEMIDRQYMPKVEEDPSLKPLYDEARKYKSAEEFVKAQGGVGDSIARVMQKELELEKLTNELTHKANTFANEDGFVRNKTPEYLQVKSELDNAMRAYKSFNKSELGKIIQQERRKLPIQIRMKMLKGDIKTKSQLEEIWNMANQQNMPRLNVDPKLIEEAKGKTEEEFINSKINAYHGTPNKEFDYFQKGVGKNTENETNGIGIWITPQKELADTFTKKMDTSYAFFGGEVKKTDVGGTTMGVFYDLKNPKIYETVKGNPEITAKIEEIKSQISDLNKEEINIRRGLDTRPLEEQMMRQKSIFKEIDELKKQARSLKTQYDRDAFEMFMDDRDKFASYIQPGATWDQRYIANNISETNKQFVDYLKSQGHDGIIIKDTVYDSKDAGLKKVDQIAVFDENQVYTKKQLKDIWDEANTMFMPRVSGVKKTAERSPLWEKYEADPEVLNKVKGTFETLGLKGYTVQSFDDVKTLASELSMDPVKLLRDVEGSRITAAENLALRSVIKNDTQFIIKTQKDIAAGKIADPRIANAQIASAEGRIDQAMKKLFPGNTEAGRAVAINRLVAQDVLDPSVWYLRAEKMLQGADEDKIMNARKMIANFIDTKDLVGLSQFIGNLKESDFIDKAIAVWKAGLLINPVTHIKNMGSNVAFSVLESIKDIPASQLDKFLSLFTGKRTVALLSLPEYVNLSGIQKGLFEAYEVMKYGATVDDLGKVEMINSVVFGDSIGGKIMDKYTKFIFRLLSAEDRLFRGRIENVSLLQQATVEALNKGLKGKAAQEFIYDLYKNPTPDMILKAEEDGKFGTFNNKNVLASIITSGKKFGPAAKLGIEIVAPFSRTPTNVALRTLDYSPIGVVKGLFEVALGKQKAGSLDFGRGVTGSAIIGLGAYLASKGMMTGTYPSGGDDKKQFQAKGLTGGNLIINRKRYDMMSISPIGNLLQMGASFYTHAKTEGLTESIMPTLGEYGKGLTEQTFLMGISSALKALTEPERYADTWARNMVNGMTPSIVRNLVEASDNYQRQKNSVLDVLKSQVPGLRETLPPKFSMFGDPLKTDEAQMGDGDTSNYVLKALKNLFDPFKVTKVNDNELIREYDRLIEAGGEDVYPSQPSDKFSITVVDSKGIKHGLSTKYDPETYAIYTELTGKLLKQAQQDLIQTKYYQAQDDQKKIKLLDETYNKSRDAAKVMVLPMLFMTNEKLRQDYEKATGYGIMSVDFKTGSKNTYEVKNDKLVIQRRPDTKIPETYMSTIASEKAKKYIFNTK